MPAYRAESCHIEQADDVRAEWLALQKSADCSYFQSWGWMSTWLQQIAVKLNPVVIRVWHGEDLVGISVFVPAKIKRHIIIHARAMFLNEYPFDGNNMVIEYNGLLAASEHEQAVYAETVKYLLKHLPACDEFHFGAITESRLAYLKKINYREVDCIVDEESLAWSVDLAQLPADPDAYLESLSKNRRAQIRRSMRLYEKQGTLKIEPAENTEQALQFFSRLKVLHTRRWQATGRNGVFANPVWESFHRSLIQNFFEAGEVQLLKVTAGEQEIGYLYNFVWRKQVYVLQTGFAVSEDKRLMSGYVSHVMAIVYNRSQGMTVYDLMHGESLYKKILCNQRQKLYWVVLQRRLLKFRVEKLGVATVANFRRLFPGGGGR